MSTTNYNWTSRHPRFVGDLNGDHHADLLGLGADGVWSSLNAGPDGFRNPSIQLVGFEANSGWRVPDHPRFLVDLNGDGCLDLLGFGDAGIWTAFGKGDGGFFDARFVLGQLGFGQGWTPEYPRVLGDLTGDGRPDVIAFAQDGIWVALNNGDGTFKPAARVSADFAFNFGWRVDKHARYVTDLTGDHRADVLGFGDDGVWIALGNGDGTFQPARFVLPDFGFNSGWRMDKHARFLVDLTGDGRPDIVGFGDDGVWVALSNGDGSFQRAKFVQAAFAFNQGWRVETHARFVADLTGSGHADLIGSGDDGIWVSRGNGDGTFRPAQFVLADFGANSGWRGDEYPRFLADTRGTSKPDLVGFGDAGVWVALNRGDGTFERAKFVLPDFGRHSNADTIVRREVVVDHRQRTRIKHVFVLMLENRSYDHLLGFADLRGTDAATGQPTLADGINGRSLFNCFDGKRYAVTAGAPDVGVAPGHDFPDVLEQLCGPGVQYPSGGPYPEVNNTGFASAMERRGPAGSSVEIMRCFKPQHLVILTSLARDFAVCDRWFSSMPGPTEPNRYLLHAASSGHYDESPTKWEIFEFSVVHGGGVGFDGGTIFDALRNAGVKTRIYAGDPFPVVGELKGISNSFDVRGFESFADDLQHPDFDPGFIHIEPKYFDGLLDTKATNYSGGNSQHPDGGVAAGERLIKATYEAIRNSPHWNSSMLIVTYDEHGGFYDHVAPGPAGPTGSKGSTHGFMFDQLGPRVPALIISPLIPRGTIEHRLLEHCSVIRTVCDLFNVPLLTHARDLRGICGVLHLASLDVPRTDTPARLPDVVVSDIPADTVAFTAPHPRRPGGLTRDAGIVTGHGPAAPVSAPLDGLMAVTLRVAALRNMAIEPNRRQEIADRVGKMVTQQEAVEFVQEVEAKLQTPGSHTSEPL